LFLLHCFLHVFFLFLLLLFACIVMFYVVVVTKLLIAYYLCMSHACVSFPTCHHFAHLCITCLPCFAMLLVSLCHLPFIITDLLCYISYLFHHFPFIVTYLLCYISYLFHHFPSIVTYLRQPPRLLTCLHYLLAIATYLFHHLLAKSPLFFLSYLLFISFVVCLFYSYVCFELAFT
jgi:hypothetical protein